MDTFDPFTIPTISSTCHKLDAISTNEEENKAESDIHWTRDYKKTSLALFVKVFEQFFESLDKSQKGERLKESDLENSLSLRNNYVEKIPETTKGEWEVSWEEQ